MIVETNLENNIDFVTRHSDAGVYIKNTVTGHEYESATDYTNEWRIAHGFEPYDYVETDRAVESRDEEQLDG